MLGRWQMTFFVKESFLELYRALSNINFLLFSLYFLNYAQFFLPKNIKLAK